MKLLEIKNNLVKISYTSDEPLALSRFIALVDQSRSYVAQIVNLKAEINSNYAIAKLIFTFNDEGIVDNYDGTIPSMQADLSYLNSKDILALLPVEKAIAFGELAQQDEMLYVDQTIFEKNLVICAEKFDSINTIIKNSVTQLANNEEKIIILDTDHTFSDSEQVRFKRDFKLPLNAEMIDYIYENDLDEVEAVSKAVIQDIFYEVEEYAKTLEFIPFDNFLKVVSSQYEATNIPELALLKHKLLKYREENIFAQTKEDLEGIKNALANNTVTYFDIADVPDTLQKELISYIYKIIDTTQEYCYLFVKFNNNNADKKILKQVLDNEHVFTSIICSHSYKYLAELKQRAENIILFAPQTVQHDFASYNTFLSKLNANEFIIYGALTQNVPFITELSDFSDDTPDYEAEDDTEESEPEIIQTETPGQNSYDFSALDELTEEEPPQPVIEEPEELSHEELVEQVAKDIDEVFYTNKTETIPSIDEIAEQETEITEQETLTEDDLDFIDELPQMNENEPIEYIQPEEFEIEETEQVEISEEPEEQVTEEVITEEPVLEDIPTDFEEEVSSENVEEELPVYPTEEPSQDIPAFEQGDTVSHPKYGKGVIEKLIKYGNKTLCSISFENVGRRLLDPAISDLQKV